MPMFFGVRACGNNPVASYCTLFSSIRDVQHSPFHTLRLPMLIHVPLYTPLPSSQSPALRSLRAHSPLLAVSRPQTPISSHHSSTLASISRPARPHTNHQAPHRNPYHQNHADHHKLGPEIVLLLCIRNRSRDRRFAPRIPSLVLSSLCTIDRLAIVVACLAVPGRSPVGRRRGGRRLR